MINCVRCSYSGDVVTDVILDADELCHACCVETGTLKDGFAWSVNCLSGRVIMIPDYTKGTILDPAREGYHSM